MLTDIVRAVVTDIMTWPNWISPGIRYKKGFLSPSPLRAGDEFTEQFGLFYSSEITWKAQIVTRSNIAFFTTAKVNTFGWDEISMNFNFVDNGKFPTNSPLISRGKSCIIIFVHLLSSLY